MSTRSRVVEFLGLRRSMVGLLAMVILVGMGEKMAERFLPIYLLALGGSIRLAGYLNAIDVFLSAIYSHVGGYVAHRIGTKRALLAFNVVAIVGYLVVIFFHTWHAVFVGAVLFLAWTAISLPATMDLVSQVIPKNKRTMGVSIHSLVRRIPMALGPLIGGLFIATWGEEQGVQLAFVAALVMALASIGLQQYLIEGDPRPQPGPDDKVRKAEKNPFRLYGEMHPHLKSLLISDILVRFCEQIPYAYAVIWCMKTISNPVTAPQFGILTTVEMVTAMTIYIPVAYFADRAGKKPFVIATFAFFTVFPLALLVSHSFWPLVAAFVVRGLKEFGEPTRKALIMDLAPEDAKAAMFGLYYLIRDLTVSIGALAGAFLWGIDPTWNLVTAFICGLCGTIWFAVKGRDLPSEV